MPTSPNTAVEIFELDLAAQTDGFTRNRIEIDPRELRDADLEIVQPRPQKLLPLLGHRPFRILGQIAVRPRALQLFGQIDR